MIELRHLRYFTAVAEEGGFVRAAQRLHISQPPLSMQIKSLESDLGVRLFDRSSRGTRLTAAGEALLGEAAAILARVEQAGDIARRAAVGETGALAIGFVSTADYHVLPLALKQFRRSHPGVQVQLRELTTDAQLVELQAARIDLGVALAPIDEPSLTFESLLEERLILAAPLDHPLGASTRPVRLHALAGEAFVMAPRRLAPGLHDLTIACCHSAGFVPRVAQYAQQMQTVISLVSSGFGFALVPESLRHMGRSGVCYRSLQESGPLVETGAVTRRSQTNPTVAPFLDALRKAAVACRPKRARSRATVA